jgi:hypothetical protein
MAFDDLTKRIGKRNGVSAELIADPAALARKHERIEHLLMLFGGIAIVVVVSALTIGIGSTRWRVPAASGALVFAGGFMIFRSVRGLLRLHRTRRAELAPARSLPPR